MVKTKMTESRSKDKAMEASLNAALAIKAICIGMESGLSQTLYEKQLREAREYISEASRYVTDAIGELHV